MRRFILSMTLALCASGVFGQTVSKLIEKYKALPGAVYENTTEESLKSMDQQEESSLTAEEYAKLKKNFKKSEQVQVKNATEEQLAQLGVQINVDVLPIIANQKPLDITKRALEAAKKGVYDLLILDTAGRLQIDDNLMDEVIAIKQLAQPVETLLVADALIGQEACNVAKTFNEKVGITGLVLTRIDGSSRAGAALSMKMVADVPIKFMGTGEKLDEIEEFHADRIAGRILGQGDVVSLVEKAIENVDKSEAEALAGKMMKGSFDLNDMLNQMRQMQKLGSMGSIIGMIPGLSKFKSQIEDSGIGDSLMKRQEAIILAMTKQERSHPDIIKASRKRRIAQGAGVAVHDVNMLLKSYEQMSTIMKKMGRLGGLTSMAKLLKNNPFGRMPGGMKNKFPF